MRVHFVNRRPISPVRLTYAPPPEPPPSLPSAVDVPAEHPGGGRHSSLTQPPATSRGDAPPGLTPAGVVMNADASRGVDVELSAGAEVPLLEPAGWGALIGGLIAVAFAAVLAFLALRARPRVAA